MEKGCVRFRSKLAVDHKGTVGQICGVACKIKQCLNQLYVMFHIGGPTPDGILYVIDVRQISVRIQIKTFFQFKSINQLNVSHVSSLLVSIFASFYYVNYLRTNPTTAKTMTNPINRSEED